MENFKQNLRVAMAARDISAASLAARVDVSRSFMSAVVNGDKTPSSGRLVEMARILNVSLDFLMGGEDVQGQIEDVLKSKPVRMTARQAYLAQQEGSKP